MKTLKLDKPWTFRTPETTIDYPSGSHEVKDEVYRKAIIDGVIKEEADGGRTAATGTKGAAGKAEG